MFKILAVRIKFGIYYILQVVNILRIVVSIDTQHGETRAT